MTFEEWRKRYIRYFRKASHGRVEDFDLDDDLKLFFLPEKGFMYYAVRGDVFHIDHTSTTDIAFMHEQARIMAQSRCLCPFNALIAGFIEKRSKARWIFLLVLYRRNLNEVRA